MEDLAAEDPLKVIEGSQSLSEKLGYVINVMTKDLYNPTKMFQHLILLRMLKVQVSTEEQLRENKERLEEVMRQVSIQIQSR